MATVDERKLEKTLERIARARQPGVLLRQLLAGRKRVERRRRTLGDEEPRYQRSLRIIVDAPAEGPLREWDQVPCRIHPPGARPPIILVRACLNRQADVWPSGNRKGHPKKLECVGCPLGASYKARLPGYKPPPPSQPAEVLSREQREAKRRFQQEHELDDGGDSMSPLKEAAGMTPDDRNDWRA
jgi:hypothetical protein